MNFFQKTPLSSSGRPEFLDDEVSVKVEDNVAVLNQKNGQVVNELYPSGWVNLTNMRIITTLQLKEAEATSGKSEYVGWSISLNDVALVEDCRKSFLTTSTRMKILLRSKTSTPEPAEIGLKFNRGAGYSANRKEEFIDLVEQMLAKKAWESNAIKIPKTRTFSTAKAGIGGIIRRQEESLQSAEKLSKTAFADLDGLMGQAKECIGVIQRYAAISATPNSDKISDTESIANTEVASEIMAMEDIMMNIGIVSPVTKFTAGRMYHQELARQVADVLMRENRLQRLGGMITLPDLYCLFNRARGLEIVSPEDLVAAASLLAPLHLPMALKEFQSGVKVVQLSSVGDEQICQRFVDLLDPKKPSPSSSSSSSSPSSSSSSTFSSSSSSSSSSDSRTQEIQSNYNHSANIVVLNYRGVDAAELSREWSVSLVVAREMLLMAEQQGVLCRDDAASGLYFYINAWS